ncbi:MAG: BPTI/Kunitz domain-containing protein [Candidatus Diapherotrites archaeon]
MSKWLLVGLIVLAVLIIGCVQEPDERCRLEPDGGVCKGAFKRAYFDQVEGLCKSFIWGGCEGTVPFETLEECKEICE